MITEYGGWKVGDKAASSVGGVEIVAFAVACKMTHAACVTVPGNIWVGLLQVESLAPYAKLFKVGDWVLDGRGHLGEVRYVEADDVIVWQGKGSGLVIRCPAELRHATN